MYVTLYYVIKVRVLKYLSKSCKTKKKKKQRAKHFKNLNYI